jgi:hypothetical protein
MELVKMKENESQLEMDKECKDRRAREAEKPFHRARFVYKRQKVRE